MNPFSAWVRSMTVADDNYVVILSQMDKTVVLSMDSRLRTDVQAK